MSETTNIVAIMVKDHNKIEGLLNDFEEKVNKDYKIMLKSFNDFEWELRKHIFIEERAIYTQYEPEDIVGGYKMLPKLTTQHNFIVNKLQTWQRDINKKRTITDVSKLKDFIEKHKNFEEKDVYPLMDQTLTEEQKKQISSKINEIIKKFQ